MGRVKEWMMTKQICVVCGKEELPNLDYSTLGTAICSPECYEEFEEIMEAVHDEFDTYSPPLREENQQLER